MILILNYSLALVFKETEEALGQWVALVAHNHRQRLFELTVEAF